eukprot:50653-Pyramimonas_sp.AAC.1
MSQAERRKAVEQFRLEKRGFFGIEDPGPCVALLRDIGIGAVEFQEAKRDTDGHDPPDSNLHLGADIRRKERGGR